MPIETMTLNGAEYKVVKLAINEKFTDEVYFMYQCISHTVKVIHPTGTHLNDNVVNLSQVPGNVGTTVQWNTNATNNTGIAYLYGRESIGSLAEKLKQTQADGSNYVLKSEVSTTSEANKVVRLGADGKLDKDMLPSIAINEYFEITDFTNQALQGKRYENGDVAVVTGSGANSGKRYLCINKGTSNATTEFIELNSKDGSVLSVNGRTGAVELNLEATDDKFKLKISGTGGTEVVKEIPMISEQDITEILDTLQ